MLSKFKSVTGHFLFVPILCLAIVIALIVVAGPYVAIAGQIPLLSWTARLLTSLVLVLTVGFYLAIQRIRLLSKEDKLVDDMTAKDDASEAIDAETEALKSKFKTAFSALKTAQTNQSGITEIPWYMIIGAPGSGKTTLLANSGLQFPLAEKLSVKTVKGIGGTKNCDWWITNNALLLDTAGRYTSQDSHQQVDESGWKNFLNLVKRYRKKPISGLIVSISMTDLVGFNEYELSRHVSQLKQRIAEVNQVFNARLPVYLVVTKADMLAGFTQFFESYSHKEREQVFGFTFDRETSLKGLVTQKFGEKFTTLCESVSRRQWSRMSVERDSTQKSLLYLFSDQLGAIQGALHSVVELLSEAENEQSATLIRGVYFTSGTQSGAPLDRMIARVAQVLGVRPTQKPQWNHDQRSYFIKEFLEQIVFSEADRFGNLFSYERKKLRVKKLLVSMMTLGSIVLCSGFYLSYHNNSHYLSTAQGSMEQWSDRFDTPLNKDSNSTTIRQHLNALNAFSTNVNGLADIQRNQFTGLGLSQSHSLQGALQASYERLLVTILMPYIEQQLESEVSNSGNPTVQYQALKSYLMLNDSEHRDNAFIEQFLLSTLNQNNDFSAAEYSQLAPHIKSLVNSNIAISSVNNELVASARTALSTQPLSEIYYRQFKSQYVHSQSNYLSMAQLAGSNWRSVLSTSEDQIRTIETFYTPETFHQVIDREIDAFTDRLTQETWILGSQNIIDESRVGEDIETLYVRDYVNRWQSLLNNTAIKPLTNNAVFSDSLKALVQTDSSVFLLLSAVSEATNLMKTQDQLLTQSPLAQRVPSSVADRVSKSTESTPRYTVTSHFEKLHDAMLDDRKQATEQSFINILQELNIEFNFQQQNPESQLNVLSLKKLQSFGYLQTPPLERWVGELVSSVSNLQNQAKKQQLNALWKEQVLPVCQRIVETRYPFNLASKVDANLVDLTSVLGKSSVLTHFFNDNLASLVNQQTAPWQWKPGVVSKYHFSRETLPFFERLLTLQRSLFAAQNTQPQLNFTLTPVYLDAKLARLNMVIFDTQIDYQFGRPTPKRVSWPPVNSSGSSEIRFVRRDGSEITDSATGIYALSRMMEKGQTKRISASKVAVTYVIDDYSVVFEVTTPSPTDPMIFNRLSNLSCLTSL